MNSCKKKFQSSNRTILELKQSHTGKRFNEGGASNRTILELKLRNRIAYRYLRKASNRTILELKLGH